MDEQPERLEMRSSEGTYHMVLARDRAAFEARGYEFAGPVPAPNRAAATEATEGTDLPAPAVDAAALVRPDQGRRKDRAPG